MICVCLADDAAVTVGIALSRQAELRRKWPDFPLSPCIRRAKTGSCYSWLEKNTSPGHTRLRPFGGILPAGTLQRLQTESDDILPRAVHAHYLETMLRTGGAGGTPVPWDELPENVRHANRAAADHMAVKLAAIDCRIIAGSAPDFAFTDAEIEDLARMEHRRWSAERLLRGWQPGKRDDDRRLHPDLKPFEDLDEDGREKDRDAVRAIPDVLALAGLSIVRNACPPTEKGDDDVVAVRTSVAMPLTSGGI